MPRTVLPSASRRGEKTPIPSLPGSTAKIPPETPLLAGRPTETSHSPAKSYIPHDAITLRTSRTTSSPTARSPVIGFTPPFASVAAITARSRHSTEIEHCRKYRSSAASGWSITPKLRSMWAIPRLRWPVSLSDR